MTTEKLNKGVGTIHRPASEQVLLMKDLTGEDIVLAESAFDVIYGDYRKPLLQKASGLLVDMSSHGAVADPESLVQDVFQALWEQRTTLNAESVRVYTWLQGNLWRRAMNELRNAKTRATEVYDMSPAVLEEDETEKPHWEPEDPNPGPETQAETSETATLIEEAFQQALNERERTAFTLRHVQDVPIADIARQLGIKHNTAKSTLANAKKKLAAWLGPRLGRTE